MTHALWLCPCLSTISDQDPMWDFRRSMHFSRFVEVVKRIIEDGKNLEVFSVLLYMDYLAS